MITIGSKSSASYLKPIYKTDWLAMLFIRKLSMSIEEQYTEYGIRFFDISVRMDVDKHTVISYQDVPMTTFSVYEMFGFLNRRGTCTVRLTLDDSTYQQGAENQFYVYCANAETMFPNINFCGGYSIDRPHNKIYHFNYEKTKPTPFNYLSPLPQTSGFFRKMIYHICPRLYAYIYNKRLIKEYADKNGTLLLDYVQYLK